jgi:CubicO group peptidase (beta-lactamase class C family)
LNDLLEPVRKKYDLPAQAGAIVSSKGIVALGAVGVRERGSHVPVTADDKFHLGTATKAMTATMIARLVEAGKLGWDTTLEKAFADLAATMAADVGKITLLQLLSHHAGLPADLPGGWDKVPTNRRTRKQCEWVVRRVVAQKPPHRPGEKYHYSNLGYVLAAAMAEKAADASWEDLMAREVFGPLGMRTAGFGPQAVRERSRNPGPTKPTASPWSWGRTPTTPR